jgi:broad specificity phosphatase PhoE
MWTRRAFSSVDHQTDGPQIVMIIRHAEKPDDGGDPNLSTRGYERAVALATVIPDRFARPDFLFAARKSSSSNRPVETITPLSIALDEPIDSTFKDDQYGKLARLLKTDAKYDGSVVLICWHHTEIPALARALGATDAPSKWDPESFDRVWEITYENGVVSFQNLPQEALPGDSDD